MGGANVKPAIVTTRQTKYFKRLDDDNTRSAKGKALGEDKSEGEGSSSVKDGKDDASIGASSLDDASTAGGASSGDTSAAASSTARDEEGDRDRPQELDEQEERARRLQEEKDRRKLERRLERAQKRKNEKVKSMLIDQCRYLVTRRRFTPKIRKARFGKAFVPHFLPNQRLDFDHITDVKVNLSRESDFENERNPVRCDILLEWENAVQGISGQQFRIFYAVYVRGAWVITAADECCVSKGAKKPCPGCRQVTGS